MSGVLIAVVMEASAVANFTVGGGRFMPWHDEIGGALAYAGLVSFAQDRPPPPADALYARETITELQDNGRGGGGGGGDVGGGEDGKTKAEAARAILH